MFILLLLLIINNFLNPGRTKSLLCITQLVETLQYATIGVRISDFPPIHFVYVWFLHIYGMFVFGWNAT